MQKTRQKYKIRLIAPGGRKPEIYFGSRWTVETFISFEHGKANYPVRFFKRECNKLFSI